jgi:hypothetical protein
MATGDNSHKLFIWEDVTLEENIREVTENQTRLMQLHEVEMLINEMKFEAAILKAFDLGLIRGLIRSFEAFLGHYSYITENLFSVIDSEETLMDTEKIKQREEEAEAILARCIDYFIQTDAGRFLVFVRDINTKNRYCAISSKILEVLVKIFDLRKISELHDKLANSTDKKLKLEEIINIIQVYSARHYDRFREFQRKCQFLNFLVTRVGYLMPSTTENGAEGGS